LDPDPDSDPYVQGSGSSRIRNTGINEELCVCADEGEAGGSEDYPHLQGEEENTLEDSKEDETTEGKGEQFVPLFRITIIVLRIRDPVHV
jgi:hypothetical protein